MPWLKLFLNNLNLKLIRHYHEREIQVIYFSRRLLDEHILFLLQELREQSYQDQDLEQQFLSDFNMCRLHQLNVVLQNYK